MKTKKVFLSTTFILITSLSVFASEQNPEIANVWNIEMTPYIWAAEIDGDITLQGRTGPAEVSFSDTLKNMDFAFIGRMEAWTGKWGFFGDGMFMDLGADFSTPTSLVSADMDMKMTIFEFGIGRRLFKASAGQEGNQEITFDLLGGGRYMRMMNELDIVPGGPLSGVISGGTFRKTGEWVDPIIGARLEFKLNKTLALGVRGDIGGFGIGEASDLTWNLVAGFDYRLSETSSFKVGYRILDIDYSKGSGTSEFGMDGQFRGPILGMEIRW